MEELSGLRTEVGNDANVAALGEMWLGAGKGQENMIMVTLEFGFLRDKTRTIQNSGIYG